MYYIMIEAGLENLNMKLRHKKIVLVLKPLQHSFKWVYNIL